MLRIVKGTIFFLLLIALPCQAQEEKGHHFIGGKKKAQEPVQVARLNVGILGEGTVVTPSGAIGQIVHDVGPTAAFTGHIYHDKFQPTVAGKINYAHLYVSGLESTETICLSIHSSDGTCLASGSSTGSAGGPLGWINIALSSQVIIVTATNYYLGFQGNAGFNHFRQDAGDGCYYDNTAYSCGAAVQEEAFSISVNDNFCIIFNDVAGSPE